MSNGRFRRLAVLTTALASVASSLLVPASPAHADDKYYYMGMSSTVGPASTTYSQRVRITADCGDRDITRDWMVKWTLENVSSAGITVRDVELTVAFVAGPTVSIMTIGHRRIEPGGPSFEEYDRHDIYGAEYYSRKWTVNRRYGNTIAMRINWFESITGTCAGYGEEPRTFELVGVDGDDKGDGTGGGDSGGGGGSGGSGSQPEVLLRRDFSGDGKADIIARHATTKDLHLYKGNGAGGFLSGTGGAISNNWGAYDRVFSAGDFSGDGKVDIIARHATTKDLHLYKGNGAGGFLSGTGGAISNNWGAYDEIFSAGDFTGDGKADIIARHATTKDLHLYKGNGAGGFLSGTGGVIGNNWGAYDRVFSAGDFSGDGKVDIIARDAVTKDLYLYYGNGTGGFLYSSGAFIGNNWGAYDLVFSAGDFTGDGKTDILARHATTKDLHLYRGNGAGGFLSGTGGVIGNNWGALNILT